MLCCLQRFDFCCRNALCSCQRFMLIFDTTLYYFHFYNVLLFIVYKCSFETQFIQYILSYFVIVKSPFTAPWLPLRLPPDRFCSPASRFSAFPHPRSRRKRPYSAVLKQIVLTLVDHVALNRIKTG